MDGLVSQPVILRLVTTLLVLFSYSCEDNEILGGRSGGGEEKTEAQPDALQTDSGLPNSLSGNASLATNAKDAVVTADANSLVLGSSLSTRPSNEQAGLSLAGGSDYDNHEEDTFVWDPAQEPLKAMNKILCLLSRTGYNKMEGKGAYQAKVTLTDCFLRDQMQSMTGGEDIKPSTVTVLSYKPPNKALEVKLWFPVPEYITMANGTTAPMAPTAGNEVDTNFYVHIYIAEAMNASNPYGIFYLRWQAFKKPVAGAQETDAILWGYVESYRESNGTISLKYHETSRRRETWSWWNGTANIDETWENSLSQQAFANLTVSGGRATNGTARTATQYSWQLLSGTGNGYAGTDESGSYATAFNVSDDRSVTKWDPGSNYDQSGTWATNYDPTAPRCEQISSPIPSVYNYDVFASDDSYLEHQLGFSVERDGADYPGWVSDTSFSAPEGTSHLDVVTIRENDIDVTYHVWEVDGFLKDSDWKDITGSTSSNITLLDCTSNCPKAVVGGITAADISGSTEYLGAGTHTYTFNATTKQLELSGIPVTFAADVTSGWISVSLTQQGTSDTYNYELAKSQYNIYAVLREDNAGSPGNYRVNPTAIIFNDRAYNDSMDAYPGASEPTKNGQLLSSFNGSGNPLKYDGYNLCCFDWEEKDGRVDEYGNKVFAQKITPGKGFSLVASNSTGNVTAGETIKFAPALTELRSQIKTDCSSTLISTATNAKNVHTLPSELSASEQSVIPLLGSKPTSTLGVKYIDGSAQ